MRGSFNQVLPRVAHLPAVVMLFFWCCCLMQHSRPCVFLQFLGLRILAFLFLSFLICLLPLFRVYRLAFAICFYVVKRICRPSVSVLLMATSKLSCPFDFVFFLLSHLKSKYSAFCILGPYIRPHSSLISCSNLNRSL